MTAKLLILHDSPDFGGHERMLLKLLPGVLECGRFEPVFCLCEANRRLAERLREDFPALRLIRWPFAKQRGEPYLRRLRWRYRENVRRLMAAEQPDLVLLVQGRIENLAVPISALPPAARLVSYIPMAHRLREMRRMGTLGDLVRRPLYRRPNRFIVPSEVVAVQVRSAGGRAPISVVENVVEPPPKVSKAEARRRLDLAATDRIALFLGRLDPLQKGLDRLLRALDRAKPDALAGWTFLFVGSGPGAVLIEQKALGRRLDMRLVAWTNQPDLYLCAADVLLLPSRWEGLPLVMLEAMHYGVPVLASPIDIHRHYLPETALIDFDRVDLPAALERAVAPEAADRFARHSAARVAPNTLDAARTRFADALAEELAA